MKSDSSIVAQSAAPEAGHPEAGHPADSPSRTPLPLDSSHYIPRRADGELDAAIARGDSIALLKGARAMGKGSLLLRGLSRARDAGARTALLDMNGLSAEQKASPEALLRAFAEGIADQLGLETRPEQTWNPRRGSNINFERYLRKEVIDAAESRFVWGLNDVDELFHTDFGSEIFGLFRSWHNKRSLDPSGPWSRLTLVIGYATEAHLFITDVNQSPFNVGTRLYLEPFTREQTEELNRRCGSPLQEGDETEAFQRWTGGQPYLVSEGLRRLAESGGTLGEWIESIREDGGVFADHLRDAEAVLRDAALMDDFRKILSGSPPSGAEGFYRLRSAGLIGGESPRDAAPLCPLYRDYFLRRLNS